MNKSERPVLKIAALGNWAVGTTQRCTWDWGNLDGNVEITLWQGTRQIATLSASCAIGQNGKGSAQVSVPAKASPGAYEIRVKSISHPEVFARQAVTLVAIHRSLPFDDGSHTSPNRGTGG